MISWLLMTKSPYSPASEWIFIQIFAGEKIMISNDSLGLKNDISPGIELYFVALVLISWGD